MTLILALCLGFARFGLKYCKMTFNNDFLCIDIRLRRKMFSYFPKLVKLPIV